MKRVENVPDSLFDQEQGGKESNRFFSILLDSQIVKTSANMCDIAEKLISGEKENAKVALEQLWELKKNMVVEKNGTIDLLIGFYQEKIDVLRAKEERIKEVSRDSRELLDEKRKRDDEIALVKQQITTCSRDIKDLTARLDQLTRKEQELFFIDQQLKKELGVNENEIVNGLYEIILAQHAGEDTRTGEDRPAVATQAAPQSALPSDEPVAQPSTGPVVETARELPLVAKAGTVSGPVPEAGETTRSAPPEGVPVSRPMEYEEKPPYPRSIVKTTRGRVIGEYFYDGVLAKAERHYIFSSKFFGRVVADYLRTLRTRFEEPVFCELLQMMQDAYKRISESGRLHFEISTNEILNEKALKQLLLDTKVRSFDEIERFCARLLAKIEALGRNYPTMLKEQMERCIKG
jgi:hypothetical protein